MIAALATAFALQGACASLEQVDVFGEVAFDTPVTAELMGTTLRGSCRDPAGSCRLRDRSGVIYETQNGRILAKTLSGGWGRELPFALQQEASGRLGESLSAAGIADEAITIRIRSGPGQVDVAVCDRALTLTIPLNTAGRARSVALVPADRD